MKNCVEGLTSRSDDNFFSEKDDNEDDGSYSIREACVLEATGGQATDFSTGGSAESLGEFGSAGSPSPLSLAPGMDNIGV